MLIYYIIAADFYYEKHDFKNRVKALKQVKKYVFKADLDRAQTLTMARYFIYQMQIDWAVQIMHPYVKAEDVNQEFLQTFLSVLVYNTKKIKDKDKYKYWETAAKKYPDLLCKQFGENGMSEEFLSDLRIKSIYCQECK